MKTVRADSPLLQLVPSELCLKCDICCRFPDADSPLAPFFTEEEMKSAVAAGLLPEFFRGERSGRIRLIPFPEEVESPGHNGGCLCPSFDPLSHQCSIYEVRPFDCQIYPFVLMKKEGAVALGIDTKCPFIQEASNSPAIRKYAAGLIQILESARIQSMLQKNPDLIGPFQDDVIILQFLIRPADRSNPESEGIS